METKQLSEPVIDEVREVRHRISERFDHDPKRLVAYYLQFQQQFRDRLLDRAASLAPSVPSCAEPDATGDRAGLSGPERLPQKV
jgi:hypothetical protein